MKDSVYASMSEIYGDCSLTDMTCCRGIQFERSYRFVYPGSSLSLVRNDEQFWTIPVLVEPIRINVGKNGVECGHLTVDEDTGLKLCGIRDALEVVLPSGSQKVWPRCVKDQVLNPSKS